jgi:hypothetical protein
MVRLINKSMSEGLFSGVRLSPGGPCISMLSYADDVIFFCGAKVVDVEALMTCVNTFCSWLGLSINIDKSGLFSSKGVHSQFSCQIRNMWCFKQLSREVMYLGLPMFLSSSKIKDFSFLKDKLRSRVFGWKSKCLSWVGRTTLIKLVAQATLIYGMSVFKLPKGLCVDLDAILRKFWWSPHTEGNSFFTPIAWSSLCKPFSDGGLGFRKFECFNEAMLSKLAWWILSDRDSFCVKVLRGKYKVRFNWLSCSPTKSSSFAWKGIESTRSLLAKGACRLVGNGVNTLVWEDPWIPISRGLSLYLEVQMIPLVVW